MKERKSKSESTKDTEELGRKNRKNSQKIAKSKKKKYSWSHLVPCCKSFLSIIKTDTNVKILSTTKGSRILIFKRLHYPNYPTLRTISS
jgi:hypothetical protein